VHAPVLDAAMRTIADRPHRFARHAAEHAGDGGRALVVGACYKPGVADLRESAALEIISGLENAGVTVDYHDPLVAAFEHDGRRRVSVPPSADGYDVVILCVTHPGQDLSWLADAPIVLDGTYRTPVGAERELL
jgi:UDP-N-acetyl-D-glucosamine dehydrogenase